MVCRFFYHVMRRVIGAVYILIHKLLIDVFSVFESDSVFVRPYLVPVPIGIIAQIKQSGRMHDMKQQLIKLLFAAEDEGRTFDPTERKIQKAREEGRVVKTQELPMALVILGVMAVLWGTGGYITGFLMDIFRFYFQNLHAPGAFQLLDNSLSIGWQMMRAIWPVFAVAVIAAVAGNVFQVGWLSSAKPITPDVSRIGFNIGKWFEKMFSAQGLYSLGFMLLRLAGVTVIVLFNVMGQFDDITAALAQSFIQGVSFAATLVALVIIESATLLLMLSFVDFRFQTYLFREQLKMTRQEIKDELKESDGDAEVKRRIQNRMREFMSRNMKENVSKADVIITNPTHFAVALRYDSASMTAPTVVAKGEDSMAFHIRRLATEFDVPLIENKPLARALYAEIEVGEEIPEQYYRAVVLIFEQVYKMKGMFV